MLRWGDVEHEAVMEKGRSKSSSGAANPVAQLGAFSGLTCFIIFSSLSAGPVDAFASLWLLTAVL